VIKAVLEKLKSNAKSTEPNKRYQPPLLPGNKVRITVEELLNKTRLLVKSGKYEASHEATFSKAVLTVVQQTADNFVTVVERPGEKFSRGACLRVPDDAKDLSTAGEFLPRKQQEDAEMSVQKSKRKRQQTDFVEPTRVLRSAAK
jgi:hypothetical protein